MVPVKINLPLPPLCDSVKSFAELCVKLAAIAPLRTRLASSSTAATALDGRKYKFEVPSGT